ncbi:MAG: peptidoglycan-binding domain-containing protein, partial [Clostridia bacterium]|nr:peptidoglycan-binding domain-containing protein [Clostridia bacterium]
MHKKLIRGVSALLLSAMLCAPLTGAAFAETAFSQTETYDNEEMSDETGDIYNDEGAQGTADSASQYITLKRGDKDGEDSVAHIVLLQNRLIELGYLYDSADGTYGANTEEAVTLFQRANNLPENGIADPALQNLIFNGTNVVTADALLDSKSAVARVQAKLVLWGFMTGTVDGVNGKTTKECIANFKEYLADYLQV